MSILEELSVEHPYYCSDSNYYSNEAGMSFPTMTDFLVEFGDADIDMNLCFRWDIKKKSDRYGDDAGEGYCAGVFLMHQRKGIFRPCEICSITEDEAVYFKAYALRHLEVIKALWTPLI